MNTKIKNKWLEDLRSGEFNKIEGKLKVVDSAGTCYYCAVGLLYNQLKYNFQAGITIPGIENDSTIFYISDEDSLYKLTSVASSKLISEIESNLLIPTDNLSPDLIQYIKVHILSDEISDTISISILNDIGLTFNELADIIEKEL